MMDTRGQSASPAIREAICSLVNRLSFVIRACWRSSSGTICIASSLLSVSTISQPQCTPASQPQSVCVTKCEPNCSTARSALSQVSYSFSSWGSSIMYRGMRLPFDEMFVTEPVRREPLDRVSRRASVEYMADKGWKRHELGHTLH